MLCCQRVGDLDSMTPAKDVLKIFCNYVFNKTKNKQRKNLSLYLLPKFWQPVYTQRELIYLDLHCIDLIT